MSFSFPFDEGEQQDILFLASQFETMLANGMVAFFEKRDFERLIDYYEDSSPDKLWGEAIELAIRQHPFTAMFFIRKAQYLFEHDDTENALICLDKAANFSPSEIEIYLLRSEIFAFKEDFGRSFLALEQARTFATEDDMDEVYLAYANYYEARNVLPKAFAALKAALKTNPTNEGALEKIWTLAHLSGEYAATIAFCHELLAESDAFSPQVWFAIGQCRAGLNDLEGAAEAFEFAYLVDDTYIQAYQERGECFVSLQLFKKAIATFKAALRVPLQLEQAEVLVFSIGRCYEMLEKYATARKYFHEVLLINAENADAFFRLGECDAAEGEWQQAISAFESAVRLAPSDTDYKVALADAFYQNDDIENAYNWYIKALEQDPLNVSAWVQYVCFLADIELFNEALIALVQGQENLPDSGELIVCKGVIFFLMGKKQEGINLLMEALNISNAYAQFALDLFPELKEYPTIMELIADFEQLAAENERLRLEGDNA